MAEVQHAKMLEPYEFYDKHYLVSLDGTGYFSSNEVHCENCCVRQHRDGKVTYYHQILSAVMVHPEIKTVLPLCIEPIMNQDGSTKNDCERNAGKRLISDLRREHPHLKIVMIEDGLGSNGPHIRELMAHNMHFILGAKPGDHKELFHWVKSVACKEHTVVRNQIEHRFKYVNQVPLNFANIDLNINFLEYEEKNIKTGKVQHFSWVTDLELNKDNVYEIMRGGRARWRIENETFNTLKNQGYEFEHNFGHGYQHLSTVFANLMFLAFLVDQVQQLCCPLFQQALRRLKRKICLWAQWRQYFFCLLFDNWEEFLRAMAEGLVTQRPVFLNSS
jgi:hypothetical protein